MRINNSVNSPKLVSKSSFKKQLNQIRLPLCKKPKVIDNIYTSSQKPSNILKLRRLLTNPELPTDQQPKRYLTNQKNNSTIKVKKTYSKQSKQTVKKLCESTQKIELSNQIEPDQTFREQFYNRKRKITQFSYLRAFSDQNQMCDEIMKIRRRVVSNHSLQTLQNGTNQLITKTIVNYNRFLSIGRNQQQFSSGLTTEEKVIQLKRVLGSGANAQVRLGQCQSENLKVAIKIFQKQKLFTKSKRNRVYGQIKILQQIPRNSHIISFIQAFQNKKQIHIIFQYIEQAQTLKDYFKSKSFHLSQKQLKQILLKIARGINHLHAHNIAHRDLKPANIIIGIGQQKYQVVKIIDFGVATNKQKADAYCGTPNFMAPQLINNKNQDYNLKAADIWALGVIFYYLCQGKYPFRGHNELQLNNSIKHGMYTISRTQSKELIQLIKQCLQADPTKRITIGEILRKQWLYSHC